VLQNFDLHEIVAQTAESVVFAGVDRVSGAPLALRRYLARSDGKRKRGQEAEFLAKAEKLRGLEVGHVTGILAAGFDEQDQSPYFLTEITEGVGLLEMLDGALLAETDARRIVAEALAGLGALHAQGLVHGSLRAERLRWSPVTGVWLGDAGVEPALLALGDFAGIGAVSTTAPELRRAGRRSMAGDFYALGATMLELLTGTPAPTQGRWPSAGDGPLANWNPWLAKMAAAEPAARPATAAEAMALFQAAMTGRPEPAGAKLPAAPTTGPEALGGPSPHRSAPRISGTAPVVVLASAKRRLVSPVAVAAILLLLAVGTGGYFLRHREKLPSLAIHSPPPNQPGATELEAAPLPAPAADAPVPDLPPAAGDKGSDRDVAAQLQPLEQIAPSEPARPLAEMAPDPAPAAPVTIPSPPPIAGPPAAGPAPAEAKEVYGPADTALMRANLGEPGAIRGVVQRIVLSETGSYLDVVFQSGEPMAFIRITDPTMKVDPALFQAFKKKKIEVRGILDKRPWGNRERPSVRFLSIDDIKLVTP